MKKRPGYSHRFVAQDVRSSRLFAGFLGMTALLLAVRAMILKLPPLRRFFPILVYQDLLVCVIIAWLFYALLKLSSRKFTQWTIIVTGWCVCILMVGYSAISTIIYIAIHAPLTYSLWLASDHMRGAQTSLLEYLTLHSVLLVATAFLFFIGVTASLWVLTPQLVEGLRLRFYSPSTALLLILYFFAAHAWSVANVRYFPAFANPELAFAASLFKPLDPLVTEQVPKAYFAEFTRGEAKPDVMTLGFGDGYPQRGATLRRPRNILLIIMESVGIRRLQICNAPYPDTPQMLRLAQHAMVFTRMYVAQAYTSGAMGAIFCSLYPQFGWQPITRSTPNIDVPGIADVLNQHGYATGFIHPGQLDFDREGEFLRDHGFQYIASKSNDPKAPADGELLTDATAWMQSHRKSPFFLALWTEDTHHPYFATATHDYGVSNAYLNRYLNAVHSTDRLIGDLAATLDKMNLSDDTLLVITGDHGEAFGEHGQNAHNWTVYDEEMRVPLLLINRKMFPHQLRVERLGRQIDLAPTLLDLLGYAPPSSWQGESLFTAQPADHAYLFSRYGNYTFGLVGRRFKYVYDFNRDRPELYDLAADPLETHDLSVEAGHAALLKSDRLKIEAWILFQRDFLKKHSAATHPDTIIAHPAADAAPPARPAQVQTLTQKAD